MVRGPLVALLSASLGLGCAPSPPPARGVVLVTLDTVRADHLGCYGYERDTSPALDAFAREATLYTRAMASSPWTLPTHASLFTGLSPHEHGARTFRRAPGRSVANPLDEAHLTLAEALAGEGFRTAAFVANKGYLDARYRLNQGFDTYEVEWVSAREQVSRAMDWLDAHAGEPFFLFLNFMDAHTPYNTTPWPDGLPAASDMEARQLLRRIYEQVMPGEEAVSADLAQEMALRYDAGVTNADRGLDDLFGHLRRLGLYDDLLIVVTSDHGEYFGEHRLVEHSKDVYQEALWIPLVVKTPGQRRGDRVDQILSSADALSLIVAGLGGERAARVAERFPGPREGPVLAENYYTRMRDFGHPVWGKRFDRVRRAVYDERYKLILSSDGRPELYDLQEDPSELHNQIDAHPQIAEELRASLEKRLRNPLTRVPAPEVDELEPDERESLRALGYLAP